MADSGAVRQARHKRHKAGDHSHCRHSPEPAPLPAPITSDPGDFDAAAELALLAGRLRDAYAADPANGLLARELRLTLLTMASPGRSLDAELEQLFGIEG